MVQIGIKFVFWVRIEFHVSYFSQKLHYILLILRVIEAKMTAILYIPYSISIYDYLVHLPNFWASQFEEEFIPQT